MQLKVFLVVAFVTNVACLNVKEDPSSLIKILKKDPSSFVESLAGADSNTINEVISMLQVLINEGNTALQGLIDRKTEAKDKLDAATTDLSNAFATQTTAEEALQEATTTKSNADNAYVDAVDKQQTADSEHTTAVNILDTEGSLLKNNNDLMEEVIGMLQTLIGLSCWSERLNGKYIQEQHGMENECYGFDEAKQRCEAASDCHGIATQKYVCYGKYRVTHGSTATLIDYPKWIPHNMWAYTLDRACLSRN